MTNDRRDAPKRRWRPHLSRAATWVLATVLAAVIGVVVEGLLTGGSDNGGPPVTTPTPQELGVPASKLVSSEKVGLYEIEADGTVQGAQRALGKPRTHTSRGPKCTMTFDDDVTMEFVHLGAGDPCVDGGFCSAHVSDRDWATTRGLQVGESTRRIFELYPKAPRLQFPGALTRFLLERGSEPCGEAEGGLEAWASRGRVVALYVTFRALGD